LGGSRDQLVIERERANLDDRLAATLAALGLQHAGMLERSDRAVLGKRARMAARDLTAVQRDRGDLTLIDANVDAAPDESGIQRVVAGIEAQTRSGGTRSTQRRSVCGALAGSGAITWRSSMRRSIGRARSVLCIRAFARSSNQQSSCSWQSSSLAKQRPGSKLRSMKSCRRSTTPFVYAVDYARSDW